MNKNVTLAIEKAVSNLDKIENKDFLKDIDKNKPDLFSLNQETELFQNDKGIIIKIDRSRDKNLTDFGKATLSDRYLGQNESFQDLFARVARLTLMTIFMLKGFTIILVIYGLCLLHRFYLTAAQKEVYLFHVF